MAGTLLTDDEIDTLLAEHRAWEREGDRLSATFTFDDFAAAFAFMTAVALISERLFHHPEWRNVWNTVEIHITDHDAGGISTNDRDWIAKVDRLLD